VLGALDLLLRWIVLRVCEGNTQCLLRVLELASRLLDELYDQARASIRVHGYVLRTIFRLQLSA
jgi:hypothetical protein